MTDTIAAVSTPPARGAVGILRVSGPDARAVAGAVFRGYNGQSLADAAPRRMTGGVLLGRDGAVLDHILAVCFPAPHSYTGEDVAELHCHGSPAVLAEGLSALFSAGARQAMPGEFTRRAFLNGRLDLIQAEAVADLIDAPTAAAARNAAAQLGGALGRQLDEIYGGLTQTAAHFHAVVDYPDEDIAPFTPEELLPALETAAARLETLARGFQRGRVLSEGVRTVLIGRPNVGKSTLFNALLGQERAITSAVPGTTRDVIDARAVVGGTLLCLVDTAGLREAADELERMGVARSRAALGQAELVVVVLDGSEPLRREDIDALELAARAPRAVAVINKADLPPALEREAVRARCGAVCALSAREPSSLAPLEALLGELSAGAPEAGFDALLTNPRQEAAVSRAAAALRAAAEGLRAGITPDAALSDVEDALESLALLTGRSVRDDVVNGIFERFCVGK